MFEVPIRAAPPMIVPAGAAEHLFGSTSDLMTLHRGLIDALESFAAGVDGSRDSTSPTSPTSPGLAKRRLSPLLLAKMPQMTAMYVRYSRDWAAGAEHVLRSIEGNPRCAGTLRRPSKPSCTAE